MKEEEARMRICPVLQPERSRPRYDSHTGALPVESLRRCRASGCMWWVVWTKNNGDCALPAIVEIIDGVGRRG